MDNGGLKLAVAVAGVSTLLAYQPQPCQARGFIGVQPATPGTAVFAASGASTTGGAAPFGGGSAPLGGGSAAFGGGSAPLGGGPVPASGITTANVVPANSTLNMINSGVLPNNIITPGTIVNGVPAMAPSGGVLLGGFSFVPSFGGVVAQPFMAPFAAPVARPASMPTFAGSSFTQFTNVDPNAVPQAVERTTVFQDGTPTMINEPLIEQYRWTGKKRPAKGQHKPARLRVNEKSKHERK